MTDSTTHNPGPPRKAGRPLISPLLRAGAAPPRLTGTSWSTPSATGWRFWSS